MEAISVGNFAAANQTGIAVNVSQTPKRNDETPTVNDRVNSVQTATESQAALSSTQAQPPFQPGGNGVEQQLRQSAVRAESDNESRSGNSDSAITTFRAVENADGANTSAVSDSAGISAVADSDAAENPNAGRFSASA